jgi:hypothetical protein
MGAVRGRHTCTAPDGRALVAGVRASTIGTGRTVLRVSTSTTRRAGPAYGPGRYIGKGRARA